MDRVTLKALKGSIAKWEKLASGKGTDWGGGNCPLCKLFAKGKGPKCAGCPVMASTGQSQCDRTPYYDFRSSATTRTPFSGPWKPSTKTAQFHAWRMLKFLQSLLPKPAKPKARKAAEPKSKTRRAA